MSQDRVVVSNDHPALNSVLVRSPTGEAVRGPIGHDEAIAIMVVPYIQCHCINNSLCFVFLFVFVFMFCFDAMQLIDITSDIIDINHTYTTSISSLHTHYLTSLICSYLFNRRVHQFTRNPTGNLSPLQHIKPLVMV